MKNLEKKVTIIVFISILLITFSSFWAIHSASTSSRCGDGICSNSEENPGNCPSDCSTICGDCACAGTEEITCPSDCGEDCAPVEIITQSNFAHISLIAIISILFMFFIWLNHKQKKPLTRRSVKRG